MRLKSSVTFYKVALRSAKLMSKYDLEFVDENCVKGSEVNEMWKELRVIYGKGFSNNYLDINFKV